MKQVQKKLERIDLSTTNVIILARRDLIPTLKAEEPTATALTLPERPRELTAPK